MAWPGLSRPRASYRRSGLPLASIPRHHRGQHPRTLRSAGDIRRTAVTTSWDFWIDRGGTFTDLDVLRSELLQARADGLAAVAIVFMHAYRYPEHERRTAALARELGFPQVSASHEVSPLIKLVSRGDTTVVDAYLSPILRRYVEQVAEELDSSPLPLAGEVDPAKPGRERA